MVRIGRYVLSEISPKRLASAVKMRLDEIPHSLTWDFEPAARENKDRIRNFKDIHKGQRCFIVANGPSLRRTNLDRLSNEVSFGLNRIYLQFPETGYRPTYYAAMNELVLEQFSGEISGLKLPRFLNWNRRSLFDTGDRSIIYLKSRMVIRDSFQHDLTRPLVVGGTVTFVALQLAYYMGFHTVILVGLDHQYNEKGAPSGTETRTAERDESHFHPGYFPKGIKWQLPDLVRSEVDFQIARDAFEADGRVILDATIGGKCPVFNKVDFSSLFAETREIVSRENQ